MKRKVGKKKKKQQDQVVAVVSDTEEEGNCNAVACIPLPAVIWSRSMTYLPASDFLNTLTAMSSNASMMKEVLPTVIVQTRKILSKKVLPPIQQAADISGLSKELFELMACEDFSSKLRLDVASILSVIASENSKSVMDLGAIPVFVSLLSSSDHDLCSAAVFGLGNLAADHRAEVLSGGVIQPLLELLKPGSKSLSIQRSASWLLSNLCRGAHDHEFCLQSFDTLSLLLSNPDEEILVESCWALVSLTNEHIESVVEANFCPRLCELLNHSSEEVVIPALRAVGNIATGSSEHIQVLLDNNVLPALLYLLSNERKLIQTEACWVISSFTSDMDQIQSVVDNANILPKLIQLMSRRAGDLTLCMEATYAIVNVTRKGNATQVNELMRLGIVRPLVQSLDKDLKAKHTFIILNGLHYVSSM